MRRRGAVGSARARWAPAVRPGHLLARQGREAALHASAHLRRSVATASRRKAAPRCSTYSGLNWRCPAVVMSHGRAYLRQGVGEAGHRGLGTAGRGGRVGRGGQSQTTGTAAGAACPASQEQPQELLAFRVWRCGTCEAPLASRRPPCLPSLMFSWSCAQQGSGRRGTGSAGVRHLHTCAKR